MLLFFLFQIEFRLCSCLQAADVLVVTGDNEDACGCHNNQRNNVATSEDEKHDGKQNRKAHRCHRHKADSEQNDDKNAKANQSCAPIDKPHACKEGHNGFAAFEVIPNRERMAEHTTKHCKSSGKLSLAKSMLHYKFCKQYGENGFANINCHNGKGCGGKTVESLEIGKTGVFAAKCANILFVNQARENNRAVDTA